MSSDESKPLDEKTLAEAVTQQLATLEAKESRKAAEAGKKAAEARRRPDDMPLSRFTKSQLDVGFEMQHLEWVFRYLPVDTVRPKDSPSTGAWAVLLWARKNTTKFMEIYLKHKQRQQASDGLGPSHEDPLDLERVEQLCVDAIPSMDESFFIRTLEARGYTVTKP
jgi:hypothetical protein